MKKCKCKKHCKCCIGCKIAKFFLKLVGIVFAFFAVLFCIFFFDLDGKLLFNVVEPFLKKHYDNMERKDVLKDLYDVNKYEQREFDV